MGQAENSRDDRAFQPAQEVTAMATKAWPGSAPKQTKAARRDASEMGSRSAPNSMGVPALCAFVVAGAERAPAAVSRKAEMSVESAEFAARSATVR